ncbi:MAG TPA: type IV pilin N-terminal domain-containing protein [Methanospirillum sp.]|uniref:type IV pilin N-terminal domain-containing protein n=1 Tax=Methanospirillum sp. TaxID=45200 RepID=UPI002C54EE90|nr:type IV pilin N-terminal domain-containing protein [Methanospirillum sp.]HOJ95626.1 type IV pilin N-terminal domain-containing protein [Methanospirillum sp.]HPP77130.1 type IV pilin N-terminal domain-containing protein [Methanospirillum sp.]
MISKQKTMEPAVSPVIGVLLMLVVTLIIAAIVSSFASGMTGEQQKTPQASLQASSDLKESSIIFEHNGGDSFNLDSISVVFQSQDTKITLMKSDVGKNCVSFEKVGDNSSLMINSGDIFFVKGTLSWDKGIQFGNFSMSPSTKCEWMILDTASKSIISKGNFVLS